MGALSLLRLQLGLRLSRQAPLATWGSCWAGKLRLEVAYCLRRLLCSEAFSESIHRRAKEIGKVRLGSQGWQPFLLSFGIWGRGMWSVSGSSLVPVSSTLWLPCIFLSGSLEEENGWARGAALWQECNPRAERDETHGLETQVRLLHGLSPDKLFFFGC